MDESSETSAGFGGWEEWRYRHEFFWNATTRWLVAVLATAALPYSSEALRSSFGSWSILFPTFACILGAVAYGHLLAEHARALYVRWHVGYREQEHKFLDDASSPETTRAHVWLRRPIRWRIGPYIFAALSLAFLSLTGFNLWLFNRQFAHDLPDAASLLVKAIGITWIAGGVLAAVVLMVGNHIRYSTTAGGPAP